MYIEISRLWNRVEIGDGYTSNNLLQISAFSPPCGAGSRQLRGPALFFFDFSAIFCGKSTQKRRVEVRFSYPSLSAVYPHNSGIEPFCPVFGPGWRFNSRPYKSLAICFSSTLGWQIDLYRLNLCLGRPFGQITDGGRIDLNINRLQNKSLVTFNKGTCKS